MLLAGTSMLRVSDVSAAINNLPVACLVTCGFVLRVSTQCPLMHR